MAQVAVEALAVALSRPRDELPPASRRVGTAQDWSLGVRQEALERLRRDVGL